MSAQETIAMMAAQLMSGILVKDSNLQSRDVDRECYVKYCAEKALALYKETSKVFQVHATERFQMIANDDYQRMHEQVKD